MIAAFRRSSSSAFDKISMFGLRGDMRRPVNSISTYYLSYLLSRKFITILSISLTFYFPLQAVESNFVQTQLNLLLSTSSYFHTAYQFTLKLVCAETTLLAVIAELDE